MGRIIRAKQTKAQKNQSMIRRLEVEHKNYNKEMRQIGCHSRQLSFDDFVRYKNGFAPRDLKNREIQREEEKIYIRKEERIQSLNESMVCGSASVAKNKEYTGTLIKGLGTMHKSSIVPIINKEQADDLAHMRR